MNPKAIIFLVIVGIIVLIVLIKVNKIKKYGKYTVAEVLSYQKDYKGSTLTIEFYFGGRKFVTKENAHGKQGTYIFIKVLPANPQNNVLVYGDKFVPDCILSRPIPDSGWNEIPKCQ